MKRIIAALAPFLLVLTVADAARAYTPGPDQCRRMLLGLSLPTWAPDDDIGARVRAIEDYYNVDVTHYQWVDPWRNDQSVFLGYGGVLEGDVIFMRKNSYGITTWSVRRHFGCAANPDRDPKGYDWMKHDGKYYYGPGGY